MFQCQDCSRRFKTQAAAQRAWDKGCPNCGSTDVDLEVFTTSDEVKAGSLGFLPGTPAEIIQATIGRETLAKERTKKQGEWW